MLTDVELKDWLHRDLKQLDKLLLLLATFDAPVSLNVLKDRAQNAGLRIGKTWNPSSSLNRSKGLAIKIPDGWEITDSGISYLRNLGVGSLSPSAVQVAVDLRSHLKNINNTETAIFVEEAIKCYEAQLYRSAVVMSWLAAVDTLQRVIVKNHLFDFNTEAKKCDPKWKDALNADGVGLMKESTFLDRLVSIGIIGKNQKAELKKALDLRNGCGHPNSLKIGPNVVAAHIEMLLLNVFDKFQI